MTKQFFTSVSPKAAIGIRKVYESEGYEVRVKPQGDGLLTVVVARNEEEKRRARA